jgi:predicted amidohydrolase
MRLSIVQTKLAWENPAANRAMFSQKLAPLRGHTDIIVLPEMFTTGFSMNAAALAEPMEGPTVQWLANTAKTLGAAIVGSFICAENSRFYNRLVFMRPDGNFDFYDKKHLFTLAGEQEYFSPGKKRLLLEWQGWRICPLICYDLRFPVWSRNTPGSLASGLQPLYDLLIYVANWPARRAQHWRGLLHARAIENQAFVAGVNIFGSDGNGLEYTGDSAIIDFSGQPLAQISGGEGLFTAELSLEDLGRYRQQLPFLQDADAFALT